MPTVLVVVVAAAPGTFRLADDDEDDDDVEVVDRSIDLATTLVGVVVGVAGVVTVVDEFLTVVVVDDELLFKTPGSVLGGILLLLLEFDCCFCSC